MIFVTGPLFAGKRAYICAALGWTEEELVQNAVWDVQELARESIDIEELAKDLSQREVVIATEIGGGVVPVERAEREARERAGRLSCLLAARADTVIRVFCGIPRIIKGDTE